MSWSARVCRIHSCRAGPATDGTCKICYQNPKTEQIYLVSHTNLCELASGMECQNVASRKLKTNLNRSHLAVGCRVQWKGINGRCSVGLHWKRKSLRATSNLRQMIKSKPGPFHSKTKVLTVHMGEKLSPILQGNALSSCQRTSSFPGSPA